MLRFDVYDVEGSFTTSDASRLDVRMQVGTAHVDTRLSQSPWARAGLRFSLPIANERLRGQEQLELRLVFRVGQDEPLCTM